MNAPYAVGDQISVMHTCIDHFGIASFPVERVTPLNSDGRGPRWRITVTRCDGSGMETTVRSSGACDQGYSYKTR